uniref:CSON014006 protein n=1 Tax=Culicoides sonorensis TaxID=179676 RepID=A0A336KU73_CULSO
MPEISQDQFETLYPANVPATPQQLRMRANSASTRTNNNNSSDVTESAVFDRSNSVTSNTDEEIAIARSSARQLRLLSETSMADSEMMNSYVELHNDHFHGYKREMSHSSLLLG